jgi:hypothetical protein
LTYPTSGRHTTFLVTLPVDGAIQGAEMLGYHDILETQLEPSKLLDERRFCSAERSTSCA